MTVKIGTNRSDRSMRSPSTIRESYRFRSVNMISCGVSLPHPINIMGHGRLRIQHNRTNQIHLFFIVFTFSLYPTFPTSTCCCSLVYMVFKDALDGLPSLGQNPTCVCPNGVPPGRAFVGSSPFCTATGLAAPRRRCCKESLLTPRDLARSCVGL